MKIPWFALALQSPATGAGLAGILGMVAAIGSTGCGHGPSIGAHAAVSDSLLRTADVNEQDWLMVGRTYSNTRHSPLAQIDRSTVSHLQVAWKHDLGRLPLRELFSRRALSQLNWHRPGTWRPWLRRWRAGREREISTPVIVDGIAYYTGSYNLVVAVDGTTGHELWRYRHEMSAVALLCCGPHNRGVAVGGDKVFVGTLDNHLLALDRQTGEPVWDTPIADPREGYSTNAAPLVADGKVIIGVSGADYGIRGFVAAYDMNTGKVVWKFWTIPSPDEGGWWGKWTPTTLDGDSLPRDLLRERHDSAKYPDAWQHGGGSVWITPSYDPALKLLYFGTGNPAPALDDSARPGDNLYTSSIVALDIVRGKLRWFYQISPHDLWDRDASNAIVLLDARVGDSTVPALAQANKTGWVYILDRRSGARLRRSEAFVPQRNMFSRPTAQGVIVFPSVFGANVGAPSAYSPQTGLMYVLGQHQPTMIRLGHGPYDPGRNYYGGEDERVGDAWGTLTALDPSTGTIRWQQRAANPLITSGALATAGGLVFYGRGQDLVAVDALTGAQLWYETMGSEVGGAPVSFATGGRQYIAVVCSSGLVALALTEGR